MKKHYDAYKEPLTAMPLNPQYLTKKQSVFKKLASFIEKFKGVGGQL